MMMMIINIIIDKKKVFSELFQRKHDQNTGRTAYEDRKEAIECLLNILEILLGEVDVNMMKTSL